jgi:hypothetical protein
VGEASGDQLRTQLAQGLLVPDDVLEWIKSRPVLPLPFRGEG